MISQETAVELAQLHREVHVANELLKQIAESFARREPPDIRDAFGRPQGGLQLGVPHANGHSLYMVEWPLAKVVIEAHIASIEGRIRALNEKARAELGPA